MALTGDYRIGPEDVISVVVLGQPDYTRTVPVRPDGFISLPAVNDLQAAGLTPTELRAALTKALERVINKEVLEVSVIITEVHSSKVSILGQVRSPMRIEIKNRLTLLDALAMAGGFTEYSKKDRILIRRLDGTNIIFNFERFLDRPDSPENIVLRGGDIIIVP